MLVEGAEDIRRENFASHVARGTSHVTRHTSHVTRHTSHITRHTSPDETGHYASHASRAACDNAHAMILMQRIEQQGVSAFTHGLKRQA